MRFLLDLLFPKKCVGCKKVGRYICDDCFSKIEFFTTSACPICLRASIDGGTHPKCRAHYSIDGSTASLVYKGIVKRIVYQFKYDPYLSDLKDVIGELFYEGLVQHEAFYALLKDDPLIIPVPLSSNKKRRRGYNHAELLAKNISRKFQLFVVTDILYRTRDTRPQFKLTKNERMSNISGAFEVDKKNIKIIKGKTIFLVDDLATTYSTLRECAKVLKRAGAKKVWGVIFAREEKY